MKGMTIAALEESRCTGCYACANSCPTDAIAMEQDAEGFPRPVINKGKCIECGKCYCCCPILSAEKGCEPTIQEVYAAWSLDEGIRYESTSGGVFSELARAWLDAGGVLCGAQYGKECRVEHVIVDSLEGLARIRQSKYAQSDMGICYQRIKGLLDSNRKVLFCGSPCQCAGLTSFLNGRPKGLLVVNFVCRGTNSPKAYSAFLSWLEDRYGSRVSRVWFKNKVHGWNRFSTHVEFEDGQVYSQDRYHDLFIRGYIEQNLYMRQCCHACDFRKPDWTADITLADFWGVKLQDRSRNTNLGTSLVIVNSERGREIFESIKPSLFWECKSIEDAFLGNDCIANSPVANSKRSYFLSHLDVKSFDELCAECFEEYPLTKRITATAKRMTKNVLRTIGIYR